MKTQIPELTIIVQSTDRFSDCWYPFFRLFRQYWPECPHRILLNSENKTYRHENLQIECTETQRMFGKRWPTWSETLIACLQMVATEIVLIMLDDFFVSGPVETEALHHYLEIMREKGYANITLTEHGVERPAEKTREPSLLVVDQRAKYRVTTSPALWRKKALLSYLRHDENAWEFEIFGSRRAWRKADTFFVANPAFLKNATEGVIPYFQSIHDSGIFKGKWQIGIKPFFDAHGIRIDYTKRGFYKPMPRFIDRLLLFKRMMGSPPKLFRGLMGW